MLPRRPRRRKDARPAFCVKLTTLTAGRTAMLIKLTSGFIAFYTLLTLSVYLLQQRLLYLPPPDRPTPQRAAAAGLAYWPTDDDFRGFRVLPEPAEPAGTVLVFHGNAGGAAQRGYYRALSARGLRVLLIEYPGYGGRPGAPSEAALRDDGRAALRLAAAQFPGPVYLWGESLGAAVAAAVAAGSVRPDGLALLTPWDSLARLARVHYWYLPTGLLLKDRYDSAAYLAGYDGPVAVLIAGDDRIVPPPHGERLYDALAGPKRRWRFDGAGHNSWPVRPDARWWDEVVAFITGRA